MMAERYWLLFLGMALVTYLPRFLPLFILSRIKIPRLLITWLGYVPVAVLSALVVPGVLLSEEVFFLSLKNHYLLASLPTFLVAIKTKNMLGTIFTGMAAIFLLNFIR